MLGLGLGLLRKPAAKSGNHRRSLTLMEARQESWQAQYSRRAGAI